MGLHSKGTHESLKAETKLLESKRTRRTQLAEQIYKYQVLSVDAALRADIKCAEDDYAVRTLRFWSDFTFGIFLAVTNLCNV